MRRSYMSHAARVMTLKNVLIFAAGLVTLKVTVAIVLGYCDYFPPNFESDFLRGRKRYFFGAYQYAFYAHIVSGPVALLLGLLLVSDGFRLRWPRLHRRLGRGQALLVIGLLAPSGLWLAFYALTGIVAATALSALAVLTVVTVLLGWRSALQKRFADHRRWMFRCFLLLSSAVVLRLIGGLATVTAISDAWSYPVAAWASWLLPVLIFEASTAIGAASRRARQSSRRIPTAASPTMSA